MSKKIIPALLLMASSMLATNAYSGFNPGDAVSINGVKVSNQRFDAYYQEYRKGKGVAAGARGDQLNLMKQLRREAMDMLIEEQLVIQAANASGIVVSDEEVEEEFKALREPFDDDMQFNMRLETEGFTPDEYRVYLRNMIAAKRYVDDIRLGSMSVTDEEVETYYEANIGRLTLPEQVSVRHILLSWQPLGASDDRKALYDKMQGLLDRARGGEDFAQMATAYSNDSTRVDGGLVGFFHRGQMVPAFEQAAFALQPGEISEIVETPYGLHIIKLEARKESRVLPLEEVREQLRDHISKENMEKAVEEEKERLRSEAEIKVLVPLAEPKKRPPRVF